jgi:D-alanyl-D-alanine carboxypeptidase
MEVSHLALFWQYYVVIMLLFGAPLDAQVNREVGLPVWYQPGQSVEAQAALEQMQAAAMEDGIRLSVFSGFRSYEDQQQVFWREDANHGSVADNYSARPGYSEHQLGTSYDVVWTGRDLNPRDDLNRLLFDWLENNAHQFGFIMSYPLKHMPTWPYSNRFLPYITDFIYEPWHIRYVGPALAQTMFEAGYLDPESLVVPQDFYTLWKWSVVESSEAAP